MLNYQPDERKGCCSMILYHGSYLAIPSPDLLHSRQTVDFGRGFYTTPLYEQASKWAEKFKRRSKAGVISIYDFDEAAFQKLNRFECQPHPAAKKICPRHQAVCGKGTSFSG